MITAQKFVSHMEAALSNYYQDQMKDSSEQWHKRNSGDTISGSSFAKCLRLCYYRWFDKGKGKKDSSSSDDIQSQRNMFYGLAVEDWVISALKLMGVPGGGIVHKNQDSPPVVLTHKSNVNGVDLTTSAANDMVVECLEDGEGRYFIPFECKTTDRNFPFRRGDKWISPQQWWEEFRGYPEHKRQLMQWIWLAEKNDMEVPFGILYYQRRGTLENKYIVVAVDSTTVGGRQGIVEVLNYDAHKWELTQRNADIVNSIGFQQVPMYDPSIPATVCKKCVYRKQCEGTR